MATPTPTPSPSENLQLYFDLTASQGSQMGLFADNTTSHHSKVWIDQAGNATPDHSLTLSKAANVACGLQVTVNLQQGYSFVEYPSGSGQCMRITAVFGRDHKRQGSSAIYDSPFTIGNQVGGSVCTVFDQWYPASSLTPSSGSVSNTITLPFGTPRLSSDFPGNAKDQYAFIVAITLYVNDASGTLHTYTAGHDPQMDIGA